MIEPLRKYRKDGRLYERRRAETTAALCLLESLSLEQLVQRAKVRAKTDPLYVSSECLLHRIRKCKQHNSDRLFESLFRILMARVESAATLRSEIYRLPNGKIAITAFGTKVRDYVVDRFLARLIADRDGYDERLDYFEVNFSHAIASLRATAKKKELQTKKIAHSVSQQTMMKRYPQRLKRLQERLILLKYQKSTMEITGSGFCSDQEVS
ncbi:hypothetical protein HED63_26470 [Ochrobactrum cytisi]|nr:hypothetical protein [Brucella cytisi]